MENKYYLSVSYARDLKKRSERVLYRFFEIFPGVLTWVTIIGAVSLSYFKPLWVAIFIIVFVFYWLAKAIYFSFYLKASYKRLKQNQSVNWLKRLQNLPPSEYTLPLKDWRQIYHLIVLPMYKEPIEIVRESLGGLIKANYPKDRFIVVLALEERAGKHTEKVKEIIEKEFKDKFFKFLITIHPQNLPGEIPAKSSNETWAAKRAKEVIDKLGIPYEQVIYSSFDIDTVVFPQYFARLTYKYLTTKNPTHASFQPIPLFLNNIWQVPAISRVFSLSTSFWHIINQEREEKLITFSSHSMAFKALVEVGFKKPDVVSDDSRIFWQCFLKYDGNYKVVPLYYPISMDANASKNLFSTFLSIYKQQRRWAYGVGDIAYFLFGFLKNKKIPIRKKIAYSIELIEGHWNWACGPILLLLLGWLPCVLGGWDFSQTLLAYNLPRIVGRILTVAMIGLFSSAYYSFYILPPKAASRKRKFTQIKIIFEWLLLPFTMFIFTSLPALDAQTRWIFGRYMTFWVTPKFRKS
ncbi:glycosyltransferase family 2 protein [bacterium]|nr:glycosyltransferase family 2 protein [bacterium]